MTNIITPSPSPLPSRSTKANNKSIKTLSPTLLTFVVPNYREHFRPTSYLLSVLKVLIFG